MKKEKGITMIALAVTVIVLLIISGITIGSLSNKKGLINEATENTYKAQKESIIEKIEADLYSEKIKTGKTPNKTKLGELANKYGTIENDTIIVSDEGEEAYRIDFNEIVGWKE